MPVTPFHFGPGSLIKSLAPSWFSLRVFILSQVIIDCESAWNMIQGHERVHTFFHTFAGSTVAIVATIAIATIYAKLSSRLPKKTISDGLFRPPGMLEIFTGATCGGYSHVLLDAIMHRDSQPFWPITMHNPYLRWISVENLHLFCIYAFLAAGTIWLARLAISRIRRTK